MVGGPEMAFHASAVHGRADREQEGKPKDRVREQCDGEEAVEHC